MKHIALMLAAMLLLTSCSAPAPTEPASAPAQPAPMETFRKIGMDEAVKILETEKDYIILDVRTEEEFAEGHIPGAINIPNETIGMEPIAELPDKEQLIMVYCRSGNRSKQASGKLYLQGYTNIVEFGGIIDWPGEVVKGAE